MTAHARILFRVNGDVTLGLGHISRCRSLMLALSGQAECRFFVMTDNRDVVTRALSDIAYELYETGDAIRGGPQFSFVIVDVPNLGGVKEEFREIADLIVCLDDSGPGLGSQDILIRPNLLRLPRPAEILEDRYWSGQVILHPDFAMLSQIPTIEKPLGQKELFVCFGGSDPCGITLRALPLLKLLGNDVLIRVVIGAAFPHGETVTTVVGRDARFILERNIPDMARVLRNADVALISGGTLLYEACASGIPSIVMCQNGDQLAEADVAHAAGAVISLGISANVPDENILSAVERLLGSDSLRQKMAGAGRLLVSPDGAEQLATRLLSCLIKRGRA